MRSLNGRNSSKRKKANVAKGLLNGRLSPARQDETQKRESQRKPPRNHTKERPQKKDENIKRKGSEWGGISKELKTGLERSTEKRWGRTGFVFYKMEKEVRTTSR